MSPQGPKSPKSKESPESVASPKRKSVKGVVSPRQSSSQDQAVPASWGPWGILAKLEIEVEEKV